jgi:hypothetical protein
VKPKYGSENGPYCDTMILIMSKFVQEKSLTICSGLDMVNINFFNIVCKDAETSQVCMHMSTSASFSYLTTNVPPLHGKLIQTSE